MGYRIQIRLLNYTDKTKELSKKIDELVKTFSGHYPHIQISNTKKRK